MKANFFDEIKKFNPKFSRKHSGLTKKFDVFGEDIPYESKEINVDYNPTDKSWRLVGLVLLVVFAGLFLLANSIRLQIIQGNSIYALAENNSIRAYKIVADRGVIYDKDGSVLVRNKPSFSIEMDVKTCSLNYSNYSSCKQALDFLNNFVPIDTEDIYKKLQEEFRESIIVSTGLQKDEILYIEPRLYEHPSLSVVVTPVREYVYGEPFAHVLGYTGISDSINAIEGKTGIEEYYNEYLTGVDGSKIVKVDSQGNEISVLSTQEPFSGKDLFLNIDKDLQIKAFKVLKEKVEDPESTADAGAIVIQDPRNGAVLSLVSYPSYNPNLLSQGISNQELQRLNNNPDFPFFNRAVSAAYPPGSVFKMITASAVLMEEVVGEYYQITDPGYVSVNGFTFRNWKLDGHGLVDLRRAIQVSNDTYFYIVTGGYGGIKGLGIQKLHDWAQKFGMGQKTGIDILGEVTGFMPDGNHREWYLGDTFISGIGQGDILSTPLQMNNMVTYFANGGYLYQPKIVSEIEGEEPTNTQLINSRLTTNSVYEIVREGMNMASEPGGTAYPLFDIPTKYEGLRVAGKTGTSEYIDTDGEERTHAWYSVFAPYEEGDYDSAEIAITVFLEGGGGGSGDAAPLARDILGFYLDRKFGIDPGESELETELETAVDDSQNQINTSQ